MTRIAGTLFLGLLVAACRPDPATVRSQLLEADREFARQAQTRGLDAWREFVADGAILIQPDVPIARGNASLEEQLGAAYADSTFSLSWEPTHAEASGGGDLGYTIGLFQSRRLDQDGRPVVGTGKYVTIWRKQPDGSWKVELDAGTPDSPR